eukprot:6903478-Prorocentrum_lima.AAC.1
MAVFSAGMMMGRAKKATTSDMAVQEEVACWCNMGGKGLDATHAKSSTYSRCGEKVACRTSSRGKRGE